MKSVFAKSLSPLFILFLVLAFAPVAASAQEVRLQLDSLNRFDSTAAESVDVSLDGQLLRLAISFLNPKDPKQAEIRDVVSGLKGIYVRAFNFDKEGMYAMSEVDSLRAQLRSPGWTRMVGVRSHKEGDNVEVYMMISGNQVNGIAVIAADPKALAVINIVGSIDLEKLIKLSGKLGIPNLDIDLGKDKRK